MYIARHLLRADVTRSIDEIGCDQLQKCAPVAARCGSMPRSCRARAGVRECVCVCVCVCVRACVRA